MTIAEKRIGPYLIRERLGAGGMGEVFRAHDPRLERDVALKLLPPAFARDVEQLTRFRREALILASLNHPNVATIFGFEETSEGSLALVLEFVEGESLEKRLTRGALAIDETLRLARQVAEALDVAHERGVVHRDLKPGNVMLGPRGLVKVLDFGLAMRRSGLLGIAPTAGEPATGPDPAAAASAAPGDSIAAVVSGTPGYMSPEQVLAGAQDARTDVFAFGCVLYECLSGVQAFGGQSGFESMARVLNEPADFARLPEQTPETLRSLIERCLEKDPERRLARIGEARDALSAALADRSPVAPAAPAAPPHNLPRLLTTFVGRIESIEAVRSDLETARLLTLIGPGGSGKTRLAVRVAESVLDRWPDGVWFADLAPLADGERVDDILAKAMGVREEPSRELTETLVDRLRQSRALVLLDNCEHVLDGARRLAARLATECAHVTIVATSREPLGLPGERVVAVGTLALPEPGPRVSLERILACESVQLFVDRARLVRPDFVLGESDAPAVAEICRRLDGLPLAIELAAARIRVLGAEQIRQRLDDRFRLLTGGSREVLERQQTLRAAIQWSVDHLADEERDLFVSLAAFAGGWTLEHAAAVCAGSGDEFAVLDILTRLVDKSLVVMERSVAGDARYRFLESVREFAGESLALSDGVGALRDRHLATFLALAEEAEGELTGPRQGLWFSRLEAEHENLLAALAWCGDARDGGVQGLRLAAALSRFWSAHAHYAVGWRALVATLRHPAAAEPSDARAKALVRAGGFALYLGRYPEARPLIEESLAICRTTGDERGIARTLSGLAIVATYQGDFPAARLYSEESIERYRALGQKRGVAVANHNLGYIASCEGRFDEAGVLFEQALVGLREVGDREYVALTLSGLALVSTRKGDVESARGQFSELLAIVRELGAKREAAYGLEGLAELALLSGTADVSARLWGAAQTLREAIGSPPTPGEKVERDAFGEALRAAAGAEAAERALDDGRRLDFHEALNAAEAWLVGTGQTRAS